MNCMKYRGVNQKFQRTGVKPSWQAIKVDVTTLIQQIERHNIQKERYEALVTQVITDDGRDCKENGVRESFSDLEAHTGCWLGVD